MAAEIDRHQARILSMQVLCQLDSQGDKFNERVPSFLADSGQAARTINYAQSLIELAWGQREFVDPEIASHAPGWTIERMTPVVRNILRTAVAEFDKGEVPPKVIINEAIEIGHEFGTADSGAFVNGVLDSIWKAQKGEA